MAKTLYDKLWESHVVDTEKDGTTILYIDRHLLHEVTSPQAFEGLRLAGRKPWRVSANLLVADHNVSTKNRNGPIADPISRLQVETLDMNAKMYGLTYFNMADKRQGIVHVIGPEQGATLPGMTVVCGDSHTSTHGAFGCLAHGIGTSEVEHVLATQTLLAKKSKAMLVEVNGTLQDGVTAKDIVLAVIGKIGTAGGTGHAIEFAGSAVRALSMEGRMTLCNMAIEAGARAGMVAVDDTTIDYVRGRPFSPKGEQWDKAVAYWKTLHSDPGAVFDAFVSLDASEILPQVTWGTSPEMVTSIDGKVPDPANDGRSGSPQRDHPCARIYGSETRYADHVHCDRQGVYRFVHQFTDRGFESCRCGGQGQKARRQRQAGAGGAGFRSGQGTGGKRRAGQDFHGCRFRMARTGMFHVSGDE